MCEMISRLCKRIQTIVGDSDAATVVEYAVVLALIIMVCIGVIHTLGTWNGAIFAYLAQRISV